MTADPHEEIVARSPIASASCVLTEASIATRLRAYLAERFPLLANGLLIFSFYSSNQFLAHALDRPGEPMRYDLTSLLGYLTILFFFLHVRIFDDHKDYVSDCEFYPDRVLQRGIVTLGQLKILAVLLIASEFAFAAFCSTAAVGALLIAFVFSVLMLREFFVADWLKQRFLIYASVHMLVMPLLAMTIWSFATGQSVVRIPIWFWIYSLVSYFLAFNWEISRKLRAPDDEIEGVDSYTKVFGTHRAADLVVLIRAVASGLVALVAWHLGLSRWFYALLVVLFLLCMIGYVQYRRETSAKNAHRMEIYSGVYILSFDLALAIELGRSFGIQFAGSL